MQGAAALQRMKLERRLAFLGTLGNNAPFIGLFGTVIGVVQAFEELGKQGTDGRAEPRRDAAPHAGDGRDRRSARRDRRRPRRRDPGGRHVQLSSSASRARSSPTPKR